MSRSISRALALCIAAILAIAGFSVAGRMVMAADPPAELNAEAATDDALLAAAKEAQATHPKGGKYLWDALNHLVKRGMTVRQLKLVLPPQKDSPGILEWKGKFFFLHYPLDESLAVEALVTGGSDDSILFDYARIEPSLYSTTLENQARPLLSRLRDDRKAGKAESAAEAVALARKLRSRYFEYIFASSDSPGQDVGPKLAVLHGEAAQKCHTLATELTKAVYDAVPKSPAAAEAVDLLADLAWQDQQWKQCEQWCNILLKEYPQAELSSIVGKRHQFSTYQTLGAAQAKLGQSSAAAESFAQSLLSTDSPVYHISGWQRLLEHDPLLASNDVMATAMPQVRLEFSRRADAAPLRVRFTSIAPLAASNMVILLPDDKEPIGVLVTIDCPGEEKLQNETIPEFCVIVHAYPAKPRPGDHFRQIPDPPAPVWSSDPMTMTARKSISKTFTVPREKIYSDRPVALLASLQLVKKPQTNNGPPVNLDSPFTPILADFPLPYWSQPMLLDYQPTPDELSKRTSPSKPLSLAEATVRLAYKWHPVACIGIPEKAPGFSITRLLDDTRVDLKSDSHVNVTYEEFTVNPAGRTHNSGSLARLDGAPDSVFRWNSCFDLDEANYVDLRGFAGDRMFMIHARRNSDEATENELAVALRVAALAIKTIRPN